MTKAKTTPEFNKLYKILNKEQKKAVDTVEGPVMVVAGPGTGKTQILTLRIANILRITDAEASSILALTFTEAGVAMMRKRLISIIGQDAYKVAIYTFHGFCNDIIMRYPDEFERIIGGEPITDIEQVSLLREIIAESELIHLRPFSNNFYFLAPIRSKISELKREGVSPMQLRVALDKHKIEIENTSDLMHNKGPHKGKLKAKYADELNRVEKGLELVLLYDNYEKELRSKRLYDYEDMILEAMHAFKTNDTLLRRMQEQYQYILADEHQDANGAQNKILELLSNFHSNPNLFIVGDEKQAIFRFQGASLENFNYFKDLYPRALLIALENNYRSGQTILDGAQSLMEGNTKYDAPLKSCGDIIKSCIELREFSTEENELLWLARDVKEKIESGVEPSEIAVLYRNNADAGLVSTVFEGENLPHRIESNQNVLADPDIRKLLVVLFAVAEFGSSTRLVPAMHLPFLGLSPKSVYRVLRFARRERVSVFDIFTKKKLIKGSLADSNEVTEFIQKLENLAKHAQKESVSVFFNRLVRESGFLAYILNSQRAGELVEKLRGLTMVIHELASKDTDYTLSSLVEHLKLLEEYNIPIKKSTTGALVHNTVRLMTAHKAKGLEFDYVYIVHVRDKRWGNKRSNDMFKLPGLAVVEGDNNDERRLFYVAITRARVGVSISYAKENADRGAQLPSIFINEIAPEHIQEIDVSKFENNITPEDLFTVSGGINSVLNDKDFLNGLFNDFGLSVSALNNYLTCPWQYFYRNLVRIPESPSKHLAFGNAIHGALQYYFEHNKNTRSNFTVLLKEFKRVLAKQPLSSSEFTESLERGIEILKAWHKEYSRTLNMSTVNELELKVRLEHVLLRGKLDKLELTNGTEAIVVDYKTGTPKSRNAILGNTKTSNGDYYRQLVFYKLILDLYNDNVRSSGKGIEYKMTAGEIDFIQQDARGKFHKERFDVSQEEVIELQETILRVSKEILDLTFWNMRCEEHSKGKCKYCDLRDLMR